MEELIQEEEMVVTLTHQGYIKRSASDNYRSQRRGGRGVTGLSTKDEDFALDIFVTSTHNYLLFFTTKGKVYSKKCYQVPEGGRHARGMAIVNLLALDPEEKVSAVFPISGFEEEFNLVMITKKGIIKKTPLSAFLNIRQNGIIAMGIKEGDELISVIRTRGDNRIVIGTKKGMGIVFHEEDVRPMGRTAMGVRGVKLRGGDEVIGASRLEDDQCVLVISENGYGKRTLASEYREQARGGMGSRTLYVTEKTGSMCAILTVRDHEDIMLVNDQNVIIRTNADDISVFGKAAQGVRLMRLEEGGKVLAAAKLPKDMGEEEEE